MNEKNFLNKILTSKILTTEYYFYIMGSLNEKSLNDTDVKHTLAQHFRAIKMFAPRLQLVDQKVSMKLTIK